MDYFGPGGSLECVSMPPDLEGFETKNAKAEKRDPIKLVQELANPPFETGIES